jgi:predicted amidophosphoribosyltransferase
MTNRSAPGPPNRKASPEQVIQRYQELRHLRRTGEEFGITRERVRQIVNHAGISTARIPKPKPEKEERFCKQCGAPVNSTMARYCETHGTPQQKAWRRYQRIKADPERYAQWRASLKKYDKRRRECKREQNEG